MLLYLYRSIAQNEEVGKSGMGNEGMKYGRERPSEVLARRAKVMYCFAMRNKDKEASILRSMPLWGPGGCLSSRAVSSQVLSVYVSLTSVFGMGTGGTSQLNHRKGVGAKHLENCIP